MIFKNYITIFTCLFIIAPYSLYAPSKNKQAKLKNTRDDDAYLETILNDPNHLKAVAQAQEANLTSLKAFSIKQKSELKLLGPIFNTMLERCKDDCIDQKLINDAKKAIAQIKDKNIINIQAEDGVTFLMLAATIGNPDICKELLDKNANCNARDNEGDTALIYAISNLKEETFDMLLSYKADPNSLSNDNTTALVIASEKNQESMVKKLLQSKADPNIAKKNGNTALLFAIFKNNESITKLLLDHNADPNALNKKGSTPLIIAIQAGNESIVKLLLEAGANPLKRNKGISMLDMARSSNHGKIIQIIKENTATSLEQKNKMLSLQKSYQLLHNYLYCKKQNALIISEKNKRSSLINSEKSLRAIMYKKYDNTSMDWNDYWTEEDERRLLNRNTP